MLTPDILLAKNMEFLVPQQLHYQHNIWADIEQCNRGLANLLLEHMSRYATHAKFSAGFNLVSYLTIILAIIDMCIGSSPYMP